MATKRLQAVSYVAFWLLLGLALALADYQDPKWIPGRRAWEPFFLEMGRGGLLGAWPRAPS